MRTRIRAMFEILNTTFHISRHCEERQRRRNPSSFFARQAGLLGFVRNDD
jgi:hypothetical protein